MIRINHFAAVLAAAVLCACKPGTEAPNADEATADEATAAEAESPSGAASALALLDACSVRMSQPIAHEWETKWNPAHIQTAGENPSGVRSTHWGDENEQKTAHEMGGVIPLALTCGSADDAAPAVLFDISAFGSSMTDVPLAPAIYQIAAKAGPAKNKPGEFIVGTFLFDKSMFTATSGTLTLERFDMNGAKGSFVIDGHEILMGSRPLHVEGTFDMPCRKSMLQSACQSNAAEQPN